MVQRAAAELQPARAFYGTAQDDVLVGDSRLPIVKDGVLRAIRFRHASEDRTLGILVQWNCHPESLGSKNKLLTADFPWSTVAALRKRYDCPIAYFTGTVGGLLAPPDDVVKDAAGQFLRDGNFEYARIYGEMVADLAAKAIDEAEPLNLAPLAVSTRTDRRADRQPVVSGGPHVGRHSAGRARLDGRFRAAWRARSPQPATRRKGPWRSKPRSPTCGWAICTWPCIPGEIYPELVYGQFQEPVEPGADFPDAPLETPVMKLLPGEKTLLFGLANDEIGYIIPKRQWDQLPPYCYGRKPSQYGEINSCGPEVAPILMKALENRVREMKDNGRN